MSIKNKFATAVATASLLAGLFGSAFVPSALAARDIALDTPSVAKTETYTANDGYLVPVVGSNGVANGYDRAFWGSTVENRNYYNAYSEHMYSGAAEVDAIHTSPTNNMAVDYYLYTKSGVQVETADLKATSSSSLIKLAWAYDNDGTINDCDLIDGTFTTSDTVTDVLGDVGAPDDNLFQLCVKSNGKPGTATITVVANGVTLAPVTITILGDIASVNVVADGTYVAEDNDYVNHFFTMTAKDSAGQVINGPATGVGGGVWLSDDFSFNGAEGNPLNQQDDSINILDSVDESNDAVTATLVDNHSYNQGDLDEYVCNSESATGENDGDAGKTYSLAIEVNNDDDDMITSNSFSITCTGPGSDAKLSKFEVEATSGDLAYTDDVDDAISIYGYFVDQAGRPLGAGAYLDLDTDFGLDSSASSMFESYLDITVYGDNQETDGTTKTEIGYLQPDMAYVAKYPYTIKVSNSDLQSATAVAKSFATFYTATNADAIAYTLKVVRSNAKTRATITANFGAECSNQMVDFDVELANGDVKFLVRRANINGVAVLNFERRNTKVFVVAYCNDAAQESNLRGIRFR